MNNWKICKYRNRTKDVPIAFLLKTFSGINLGNWITSPTFCFCFTDNIVKIFRIDVWFGIDRNNKYGEYDKVLEAHFNFVICLDSWNLESWCFSVSVDLRVSRIYRHLTATPSFGGQTARAGGTPRLSYLPFQTMELPLDGDITKDS